MDNVPAWKLKEVKKLSNLLETSPVIGVVDIEGIPALQMQQMRAKLRGTMNLTVSRNTLIEKALENASEDREGIEEIKEHLSGQTALISTNLNPFKLYKRMEDTKTKAPASGGETAPEDIKVEKGDTPFKPGPIVGDLQKVGIPASIQGGKVVINKTKTVVKEGETISPDLARMLTRLEIQPITVGLDLRIAFEEGTLFDKDTLDIDSDEFINDLKSCAASAFSLSVNAGYPTKKNIKALISKAHRDSFSLALNSDIMTSDTVKIKLSEASMTMLNLSSKIDTSALDSDLKEKLGIEEQEEEEEPETEKEETEEQEGEETAEEETEEQEDEEETEKETDDTEEDDEEKGDDEGEDEDDTEEETEDEEDKEVDSDE